MQTLDIDDKLYLWYSDRRRFGFDRFVTGIFNRRDIFPFTRNPINAEY